MFSNQLTAVQKITDYLNSKKEKGIEAFKNIAQNIKAGKPKHVVFLMMHEHLEAYVMFEDGLKMSKEFFEVLSNYELEELPDFEYDENIPLEDYVYWRTFDFCQTFFLIWIAECYHASNIKEQLDIPFYYMGDHESEEIFRLNDCKKIMNRKAVKLQYDLTMKNNVMDNPLGN